MSSSNYRFNIDPYVDDITEVMREIALERYGDNLALIVMYGSRAKGTSQPDSDIEYFAIAENDIKVDIEFTFNGIPIDMWSQTWENIERISMMDQYWVLPAASLMTSKPIYFRSEEDQLRWYTLLENIHSAEKYFEKGLNLASEAFTGMYGFLGNLQLAKYLNDRHQARDACWNLIISVTIIVAQVNTKYLLNNWGLNVDEIYEMKEKPKDLEMLIDSLVCETNFNKQIEKATVLVNNTREFMIEASEGVEGESHLEMLRTSDCIAYLNKIKKASRMAHILGAGYAVHDFQSLVARDLQRLTAKWNYGSKFKVYSEYNDEYNAQYPDFYDAISKRDFSKLFELANQMYDPLLEYNMTKVPDVESIGEIRRRFLS